MKTVQHGQPPQPLPGWAKACAGGQALALTLHVQPGASASGPAGRHGEALKLRLAAPATDNRANDALIEYLRDAFALPRAAVRIAHGARSRHKVVAIDAHPDSVSQRLRAWDQGRAS
jgi:uncharacterized protein